MEPSLASNSQTCLCFPSAGIASTHHHQGQGCSRAAPDGLLSPDFVLFGVLRVSGAAISCVLSAVVANARAFQPVALLPLGSSALRKGLKQGASGQNSWLWLRMYSDCRPQAVPVTRHTQVEQSQGPLWPGEPLTAGMTLVPL